MLFMLATAWARWMPTRSSPGSRMARRRFASTPSSLAEPQLARSPALRAAVARLADDPSVRVRFQVAFTLGEIGGDEALRGLAAIARRDAGDLWVRTAVLSSATADPGGLFERLWQDRDFAASAGGIALLRPLALVVGVRNRPGEAGRILAAVGT